MMRLKMDYSIPELVQGLKAGEESAIRLFVRRYRNWAMRYAAAITRDDGLAEDAVQEAFITIVTRIGGLRHIEAFTAWVRCVLRNSANRMKKQHSTESGYESAETVLHENLGSDQHTRDELLEFVRQAVRELPEYCRETTELHYFDEWSIAEIADKQRIPVGTVKRRLHDARRQLRDSLTCLGFDRSWSARD